MMYEDALKVWGAQRLREANFRVDPSKIDTEKVVVEMQFDEGYACCGGYDPNCYCSFAESPSANVVISCGQYRTEISTDDFDFATILGEIVAAGNGTLTE